MNPLEERDIECPHCGEIVSIVVDCESRDQSYIEDCMVCCSPFEVHVSLDEQWDEIHLQITPTT